VAPSFIFISGFAFVISTHNKFEKLKVSKKFFWKKLGRIVLIFVLGYLMHIPYYSLRNIIVYASSEEMRHFYNVDVLQCIGAGLLILLFLRMLIRSNKVYFYVSFSLAILTVLLAPFVWSFDFSKIMPLPLACYFNEVHGSFFPIFPWLGFLFAGASLAFFVLKLRESGNEELFFSMLKKYSFIIAIISFSLSLMSLLLIPGYEIKSCPFFFMERLAIVIFLLTLLRSFCNGRSIRDDWFFLEIGRESLLVYFLHLQIIYRNFFNGQSLNNLFGLSLNFSLAIASSLVLIILMFIVALFWAKIKKFNRNLSRFIFVSISVIFGIKFIFF